MGSIPTAVGAVPRVSSTLEWTDHWGTLKARCGIGRMRYQVDAGLYALGSPDRQSPVVVTANYKMSFDCPRAALRGTNTWILVLDTGGINVWCAAGKGTFGTEELVNRVKVSGLGRIVSHRRLILPQLSAPGVSMHRAREQSGFQITYGPIRAQDLPRFLEAGLKATPEMRLKSFTLLERLVLTPVELRSAMKGTALAFPLLFLIAGLTGDKGFWTDAWVFGSAATVAVLCGIVGGVLVVPLLLPWLPGRAFSIKGLIAGVAMTVPALWWRGFDLALVPDRLELSAWMLVIPALASYLGVNFTGCSTFTSLSGVRKEMRWALPLQAAAAAVGALLWMIARLVA